MDLLALQCQLEDEARRRHREGWLDGVQDALSSGRAGSVPVLHRVMAEALPSVEAAMLEVLAETTRGFGAQYRGYLRELGARECASLALSMAVSAAAQETSVVSTLKDIGKAVMAEVVYRRASSAGAVAAAYMERVRMDNRKSRTKSPNHALNKVRKSAHNLGLEVDNLPQRAFITMGRLLFRAVAPTGLIEVSRIGGSSRQRAMAHFALHDNVLAVLRDWMDLPRVDGTCCPPMIVPPAPIDPSGRSGMWHTPGQSAMYRVISRMNRREYTKRGIDPTPVISSCMALSGVAYRVNPMVLEFLLRNRTGVMGLPVTPSEPTLPFSIPAGVTFSQYISRFPEDMQQRMDAEAHEYKIKTRLYHVALRKFTSQMLALGSAIREAERYASYDAVYLPTYADTRGRIYYSSAMNPQGIDAVRALLELAQPVPLGKDGLYWLKVHVANCLGYDSTNFDDRAAYTDKIMPRLREACRLPEAYDSFWSEADYPMSAWAAATDMLRAIDSGKPAEYLSRTVTQWDATCSGLQHLSAMLRDEVGGAAVNLVDSPTRKADIYLKVAAAALDMLKASESKVSTPIGQWLLTLGITRTWAKKPVMTYVYSATKHGMIDYYCLLIRESRIPLPPGHSLMKVAAFVAELMWNTIPKVVPKAALLMNWLQTLATSVAATGEYVAFTAPSGLVVPNNYEAFKDTQVKLNLMGIHGINIRENLDRPDSRKCAAAIAPNFVHAMDASHMMRVLKCMTSQGIGMVSIHDSFGCAAAHAGTMHRVIREQFVDMYEECDPISELASAYGVDNPLKGNLNIREVLNSSMFFC